MLALLLLSLCSVVLAAFDTHSFFPIAVESGFTALPSGLAGQSQISTIPLSLAALGATKISKGVTENVVAAPGGAPPNALAIEAVYPKGSYVPTAAPRGGFAFYFPGPSGFAIENVTELLFSYAVYFPPNFQFNMGGKLPGPYGGTTLAEAEACSGGRQQGRNNCFDLRLMWRTDGLGEIYAYLPENSANDVLKNLAGTVVPDEFGISIARGAFSFAAGSWTVVAQRVKLNDNGASNGELELFVNGKTIIHATGIVIRVGSSSAFRGIHAETFFGGDSPAYASPQNQSAFFAGLSAAAVKPGASPAEGQPPYPLLAAAASSASSARPSTVHSAAGAKASSGGTTGSPSPTSDGGQTGGAERRRLSKYSLAGLAMLLLALL